MNKIMIPAILVATVMVAGAFAFMPVEQASTVHTTTGISSIVVAADDQLLTTSAVLVADSATIKNGSICFEQVISSTNTDAIIVVDVSSDGAEVEEIAAIGTAADDGCADFTGYAVTVTGTDLSSGTLSYAGSFTERSP